MQPENYYSHHVWTGTAFLQCNDQYGLEQAFFVGEAWGTGDHAMPIPAAYIPMEGRLKIHTTGWTGHLKSGRRVCSPTEEIHGRGISSLSQWTTETLLVPGQIYVVGSGYTRRIINSEGRGGRLAILFPSLETTEAQTLECLSFNNGMAVISLGELQMNLLLQRLHECLEDDPDCNEELAGELLEEVLKVVTSLVCVLQRIHPVVIRALNYIRSICMIEKILSMLESRIRVGRVAKAVNFSQKWLEKLFRDNTTISVIHYILWRRFCAAMEQRAVMEQKGIKPSATRLAGDANFSDSSHFGRTHQEFFGLPPAAILHTIKYVMLKKVEKKKTE